MPYLLEFQNVSVSYTQGGLFKKQTFWGVRNIFFQLKRGETLALLGESGSGKSTIGRVILRLLYPTKGKVLFKGKEIFKYGKEYTKEISAVFQDPAGSLNPRYTVWEAVEEPLLVHGSKKLQREEIVANTLRWAKVEESLWRKKTHELSGGQKQRVAIARAIVLNPSLIVADEPTSALDLSVQYEILKLFGEIKKRSSMVFITHDLRVASKISDKVLLLLGGRIMEISPTREFVKKPLHPYGEYLLKSLPTKSPYERELSGEVKEFKTLRDGGCPFRMGCPYYEKRCEAFPPPAMVDNRTVYCWKFL